MAIISAASERPRLKTRMPLWLAIALAVFGLPGLGRSALQALDGFDLPAVMGIVVFATICVIVFNLFVDLLYAIIDPRIRLS